MPGDQPQNQTEIKMGFRADFVRTHANDTGWYNSYTITRDVDSWHDQIGRGNYQPLGISPLYGEDAEELEKQAEKVLREYEQRRYNK